MNNLTTSIEQHCLGSWQSLT